MIELENGMLADELLNVHVVEVQVASKSNVNSDH